MYKAVAKQDTTMATQTVLMVLDLAVEMWANPWIVEPSKKFWRDIFGYITAFVYSLRGFVAVENMSDSYWLQIDIRLKKILSKDR